MTNLNAFDIELVPVQETAEVVGAFRAETDRNILDLVRGADFRRALAELMESADRPLIHCMTLEEDEDHIRSTPPPKTYSSTGYNNQWSVLAQAGKRDPAWPTTYARIPALCEKMRTLSLGLLAEVAETTKNTLGSRHFLKKLDRAHEIQFAHPALNHEIMVQAERMLKPDHQALWEQLLNAYHSVTPLQDVIREPGQITIAHNAMVAHAGPKSMGEASLLHPDSDDNGFYQYIHMLYRPHDSKSTWRLMEEYS